MNEKKIAQTLLSKAKTYKSRRCAGFSRTGTQRGILKIKGRKTEGKVRYAITDIDHVHLGTDEVNKPSDMHLYYRGNEYTASVHFYFEGGEWVTGSHGYDHKYTRTSDWKDATSAATKNMTQDLLTAWEKFAYMNPELFGSAEKEKLEEKIEFASRKVSELMDQVKEKKREIKDLQNQLRRL